jgi:hypothetical protein
MPITSPVDGKAECSPAGRLHQVAAGGLCNERHGARGPRVRLDHVDGGSLYRELHVDQPAYAQRQCDRARLRADLALDLVAQRQGRDHAGRVARVHAGLLHVLHDGPDPGPPAVADRIHVDLDRVLDEAVDQRRGLHRPRPQHRLVVTDAHLAAAQYVGGPHQHRVTDAGCDRGGLVHVGGDAPGRRLQAQVTQHASEPLPILGHVDRLERRAQELHALLLEPACQPQRRLAAELGDHADRVFALDHLEHVLDRQRLEVEPVGGVRVG